VAALSDKPEDIFDRLYRDSHAKVYRLALGLTGSASDAEEITQEAFIRAFRSYQNFRGDSSFFTWIYRITLNAARDYLKQRTRLPIQVLTEDYGYTMEQIIDSDPANDPEAELLANEARQKCLHCFTECLPTGQRVLFCLVVTLGLPYKTAAEIIGCSPGAVKTTLHRAKNRVAGYLEDRCQLIKRSNPCNCHQWVRFALSQGWISKQPPLAGPRPKPIDVQAREEIAKLQTLRSIYQNLYPEKVDEALAQRISQGIKRKEWNIFS